MQEILEFNYVLDKGAYKPVKAHEYDAGFDLKTPIDFELRPGESVLIDTGVHIRIPEGYTGFIKSRSGLDRDYSIKAEGVIDAGYTGSIGVKLYRDKSANNTICKFEAGDKITQIVFLPIPNVSLREVIDLGESDRGNKGFGSSGR